MNADEFSDTGGGSEPENKSTLILRTSQIKNPYLSLDASSQSSEEEPILPRKIRKGTDDEKASLTKTMVNPSLTTNRSKKVSIKRAGIGRQIPALKMRIEILQDDIMKYKKDLEVKNKELEKYAFLEVGLRRKINRYEHEMKELREQGKLYKKFILENENLRCENEELRKMNQVYERNYSNLEKKYDMLKEEHLAKLNNRQSPPTTSTIREPWKAEEKNNTLTVEEKFNLELEAAIAASMTVSQPVKQEKSDQYLKQEIDFMLELSKKEDEIRQQREHSLAIEELFRNNVEAERAVKRKLESMETEKEKVTKRLKVVEQEKEELVDEKEKLVDELECTTLCGFCTENMKDAAFEPCGHIWACFTCIKTANISTCPTCRKEVKNVRKVFLA